MNWKEFTNDEGLENIKKKSSEKPQVIFKHSTKCSISTMAKSRLERSVEPEGIDFNYLDLIAHKNISAKIKKMLRGFINCARGGGMKIICMCG